MVENCSSLQDSHVAVATCNLLGLQLDSSPRLLSCDILEHLGQRARAVAVKNSFHALTKYTDYSASALKASFSGHSLRSLSRVVKTSNNNWFSQILELSKLPTTIGFLCTSISENFEQLPFSVPWDDTSRSHLSGLSSCQR